MSFSIAIQMDKVESLQIDGDTTFALGLEAQKRGHNLWYYTPDLLSLNEGIISARGQKLTFYDEVGSHFKTGAAESKSLQEFDVILMRQDPPFDMAYITATYLLEMLNPKTMIINNPAEVRNAPEKLLVNLYPDFMPPTLISRDVQAIKEFRNKHEDIIVKPLFGNGGAGVFRIRPSDQNLNSLLEMFFCINREPLVVQSYLPAVRHGDKRIILVDGNPVGAVTRIPSEGEVRSNFHVGGIAAKASLTKRELEICTTIGPELRRRGLLFVGIDVIGDYMTEINVTSPTGIREIERLSSTNIASITWDIIEQKHSNHVSNGVMR
jgi:glutathione synthase